MHTIRPISRITLSEQVAVQITEMIAARKWKPGDTIPSEADLCRAFGISRPTVREALKALDFVGLVQMRTGHRTYVSEGPAKFVDRLCTHGLLNSQEDVEDLTLSRLVLEGELAALCAQRVTDEELQNLETLVDQIGHCTNSEGFLELDLQFHLAIATYSRSKILAQLLRAIRGLLQEVIRRSAQLPGDKELTYGQHKKILQALKERSARKARSTMREHLRTFRRSYSLLVKVSESENKEAELTPAHSTTS
jgi:GntR family transcriptional repressor for pyruvate dehydrogenase complex